MAGVIRSLVSIISKVGFRRCVMCHSRLIGGEVLGFLGPDGTGKTTMIYMLMGGGRGTDSGRYDAGSVYRENTSG